MNTRRIHKVLVAALLGTASICSAAEGTWIRKADMPTARFGLSTSVVDAKIYAIGGSGTQVLRTVEEYDPATDTWTRRADMPTARAFFSASVVNGKIYAIGGILGPVGAGLRRVEEYDPATDMWTRKADMPTGRLHLSTIAVNGRIYAMGGMVSDHGAALQTVEEYDPLTDTWTRESDMPTTRLAFPTCVVNGKMYAIGGVTSPGGMLLSTVTEYDPATGKWTEKANMPTARLWLSATSVDTRIYAVGGCTNPFSETMSTVEEYDLVMNIWTKKAEMSTARKALSTSTVNGKIYAIGGTSMAGWGAPLSTVEEYNLIPTPPDFNGDGLVDIKDLLKLIESWGQDDPIVDIASPPFGDGIVDALDLELLMSYWEQPVDDPTLLAEPAWQPDASMVGGALAFDGIDDRVFAQDGLNPADAPFSIFAWIQGGAPGQVVISQLNEANWLAADSAWGCLRTGLCASTRSGGPLKSEMVITDGAWHRIGFVWDGVNRALYVDDILVAEDTQQGLGSSDGGLNIGCGIDPAGTFWSGLIDDVRIYNRAVRP
ncbi:MAG: Kelch repeat-containing protein [Planctomycetota bacterium]